MQGGFPIDLILFAMVAAFLVLRLRSVLGRRTGFERPPEARPAPGYPPRAIEGDASEAVPVPPAPQRHAVPDAQGPVGQTLANIQKVDPSFSVQNFLGGAETAFRMIVEAFKESLETGLAKHNQIVVSSLSFMRRKLFSMQILVAHDSDIRLRLAIRQGER